MPKTFAVKTPLGQRLRDSGLTSSRFSALTGVNYRTITEHLAGRKTPLPHELAAYSEVLGVDPAELLPSESVAS